MSEPPGNVTDGPDGEPPTVDLPSVELIRTRLRSLQELLAGHQDARRGSRPVRVLAVTKGFPVELVERARQAGLDLVGENYAQELLGKATALVERGEPAPQWHFIGRLQRNKIRLLAPVVAVWQSIDRDELVDELARRAPGASIMVQANLSGAAQKGGAPLAEVPGLVERARSAGLDVIGLMGVGPEGPAEAARTGFRALVELADALGLEERSIGMSGDLAVAVEEGSTMVRVGTALFGPRRPRSAPESAP